MGTRAGGSGGRGWSFQAVLGPARCAGSPMHTLPPLQLSYLPDTQRAAKGGGKRQGRQKWAHVDVKHRGQNSRATQNLKLQLPQA